MRLNNQRIEETVLRLDNVIDAVQRKLDYRELQRHVNHEQDMEELRRLSSIRYFQPFVNEYIDKLLTIRPIGAGGRFFLRFLNIAELSYFMAGLTTVGVECITSVRITWHHWWKKLVHPYEKCHKRARAAGNVFTLMAKKCTSLTYMHIEIHVPGLRKYHADGNPRRRLITNEEISGIKELKLLMRTINSRTGGEVRVRSGPLLLGSGPTTGLLKWLGCDQFGRERSIREK
jgi:hypothetical protein